MQASTDLWLFFAMVFGVIALPGMDMAFVASSALTHRLRGGFTAVAGIIFAGILHTIVGATGVAALMLLWPAAFNALLLTGAAYMVWIGASILRSANATTAALTEAPPHGTIFRRAVLTCLLNPKAYAFMLAVFPAFIRSADHSLPMQAFRLGAVIAVTQLLVYGAVAVFVSEAQQWAGASDRGQRWAARIVGVTLIAGAALTLAFAWRPSTVGHGGGFVPRTPVFAPGPGRTTTRPMRTAGLMPEAVCRSPAATPTGSSCKSAAPARHL